MFYGPMLSYNRFTAKFIADMRYEDYLKMGKRAYKYVGFLNQKPIAFLKSTFVYIAERNGYRIDPLSMMFANFPESYKVQGDALYYKIYKVEDVINCVCGSNRDEGSMVQCEKCEVSL